MRKPTKPALCSALRIAKRRAHLTVAIADVVGIWPLKRITRALSDFADAAVAAATSHLLRLAHSGGELELPHPDQPVLDSGLIILGLGKLGARELNYSSDIDLIVLFDLDRVVYRGKKTARECFVKLTRGLVRLLQDATADGYVLRVDLRLRPDPSSTPLAMSTIAAETYYEGMGQNWERAAMIKARVIAGDVPAGSEFLRNLRPFIWRKHLDFAAIQDIHSIKRQIHAVKGHREIAVGGHNIKIGRGGIREIEFFAQTQQLIWGGRSPDLRLRRTCAAIEQLVTFGRTSRAVADDLKAAYRYLRHVEHRLQMLHDQQTQTLPNEGPELDRLALFCGHADTADFSTTLMHHLGQVEDHYADLFEESPALGEQGNLVFTGTEDDPATVATLERMGFPDGSSVSALVRAWHHGRYRATRSARARELLTELMPKLLEKLSHTADPDTAFKRFDSFMRSLPAGVQLFSLLYSNPELLDLIADVMGSAPLLADHLSRYPMLLDGVLTAGFFEKVPDRSAMSRDLHRQLSFVDDFQDRLSLMCRWTKDRQFQIGVRLLRGVGDGNVAAGELSDVADAVIGELLSRRRGGVRARSWPPAGARNVRGGAGQARQPRDDGDLRPRPHLHLRHSGGCRRLGHAALGRAQAAGADPVLRAPGAAPDHRADRDDRRRQALRSRHAAAPVGQFGPDRQRPRAVRALPDQRCLDLGAHGADPRPADRRRSQPDRARGD